MQHTRPRAVRSTPSWGVNHRCEGWVLASARVGLRESAMSIFELESQFVEKLPGDPLRENRRREVLGAFYSEVDPTPVQAPSLVAHSREVAELLGLSEAFADSARVEWLAEVLSGNRRLPGSRPYAAVYGGHQFGNWAGQLGDGRAITLGERTHDGLRWELQLKGAGPTPYSRMGDGRAVLRSSVREFLCSEAMHHLGVPTTRALSLVTTGDEVVRDMFYDGHPKAEPGAIVCRVAPTFLRFGNFEIFAARGDKANLKRLADYVLREWFPELLEGEEPGKAAYLRLLEEAGRRTAKMIVEWMRVGFVHGVMNTDNMSILGLTIDYGPYGWLEDYDPSWTPNTTDSSGRRYRYGQQPAIAFWNLCRFAEALFPLVQDEDALGAAVEVYRRELEVRQGRMLADKLGLRELRGDEDPGLFEGLYSLLPKADVDMTIFFRKLADVAVDEEVPEGGLLAPLDAAFYSPLRADVRSSLLGWLRAYRARVLREGQPERERKARMNRANPKYVLRNYLAQLAIDKAEAGDGSLVRELLDVLRAPYDEQPEHETYAEKRPDWARSRPGCSMLSCSS